MIISFSVIPLLAVLSTLISALAFYVFSPGTTYMQDTTLLSFTNIVLGLAVIVLASYCIVKMMQKVIKQKRDNIREQKRVKDLLALLSKVGITMQDGGEEKEDSNITSEE